MADIVGADGKTYYKPWPGPLDMFWNYRGDTALVAGGAYSGKTQAIRWYPWQQLAEENERIKNGEQTESAGLALITRRTMPKLRELMSRCAVDFPRACPEVRWVAGDKTWLFPSGYRIVLGHMAEEEDWQQYHGWNMTFWGPDELSTFTEKQYNMVSTWVRKPAGCKLTPIIRGGTNWVGAGLEWVRRRFYEVGTPGRETVQQIEAEIELEDRTRVKQTIRRSQICILATVRDNKSVDQAAFIATLSDKPLPIRRALIDGDPYVVEEGLIAEVWDKQVHVCKPFKIKRDDPSKFRTCHFRAAWPGLSSVCWWIVDTNGAMTCYRSLTVANHTSEMLGYRIREIEIEAGEWDTRDNRSRLSGPLDRACWPNTNTVGPSAAETMFKIGVIWVTADEAAELATDQVRIRLTNRYDNPADIDKKTKKPRRTLPGIRWFDTCLSTVTDPAGMKIKTGPLSTVPIIPSDENNPDLPHKEASTSDWYAAAYAAMARPMIPGKDIGQGDRYEDEKRLQARYSTRPKIGRFGVPGGW